MSKFLSESYGQFQVVSLNDVTGFYEGLPVHLCYPNYLKKCQEKVVTPLVRSLICPSYTGRFSHSQKELWCPFLKKSLLDKSPVWSRKATNCGAEIAGTSGWTICPSPISIWLQFGIETTLLVLADAFQLQLDKGNLSLLIPLSFNSTWCS